MRKQAVIARVVGAAFCCGAVGLKASAAAPPAIVHVGCGGGTAVVIGDGFGPDAKVMLWSPSDGAARNAAGAPVEVPTQAVPAVPPSEAKTVSPVRVVDDRALYAALPTSPAVMWVRTANGVSSPRVINRPEIWLASDDRPAAGDRLRLFGRCFLPDPFSIKSTVALRSAETGKLVPAKIFELSEQVTWNLDDHEIDAMIPDGLRPGAYDVFVNAGHYGFAGWSAPYRISISAGRDLAAAMCRPDEPSRAAPYRIWRVTKAAADGVHDDSGAIQAVIDSAAAQGSGLVQLPSGLIAIARTLHVRPGIVLRGSGRGATSIVVWPGNPLHDTLPPVALTPSLDWQRGYSADWVPYMNTAPMVWMETQSGIQDMTLVGGPGATCAVFIAARDWHNVSENVSIVHTDIETTQRPGVFRGRYGLVSMGILIASSTRCVTLFQCRLTCPAPLVMLPGRLENFGTHIIGNTITVSPRNETDNAGTASSTHALVEDNVLVRGARALGFFRGCNHNWVFNNTISDVAYRINGGELLMSEYGVGFWRGFCSAAGDRTIKAAGAAWKPGQFLECSDRVFVFVEAGRGFGQIRQVTGNTQDTLSVDAPWDVAPDTSTRFSVLPLTYRNLYINNTATNCDSRIEFAYGSLVDCVVSGQRTQRCEGLSATALHEPQGNGPSAGCVVAYNEFSWNRLIELSGIHLQEAGRDRPPRQDGSGEPFEPGSVIGNAVRSNEVMDFRNYPLNQYYSLWHNLKPWEDAAISIAGGSYNVIEDNYASRGPVGIRVGPGKGNLVIHNMFDAVTSTVLDRGEDTILIGNSDPSGHPLP